jgi:hypothetical protein
MIITRREPQILKAPRGALADPWLEEGMLVSVAALASWQFKIILGLAADGFRPGNSFDFECLVAIVAVVGSWRAWRMRDASAVVRRRRHG